MFAKDEHLFIYNLPVMVNKDFHKLSGSVSSK